MLSFLYNILIGHCWRHKWKIIQETEFRREFQGECIGKGTKWTLQCEKCGKLTSYDNIT